MSQLQSHNSLVYDVGDRPVPGHTLIRVLGEGAMGKVWLAQTDNGFERALKVVDHLQDSTGRKEYRGLRTVKQRKLLNGNLLTLIDYWLKDAHGNLVADAPDSDAESSVLGPPQPETGRKTGMDATTSQKLDKTPGRQKPKPAAAGTLVDVKDDLPSAKTLASPPSQQSQQKSGPQTTAVQLIVAMELGHKTLSDRLRECQGDGADGIPLDELLPNMMDAARGLDYLHREGVLHRDVKPHNIMLVGEVAKVCDYGLVVSADRDLTKTSKAYTPYYASPEAVENQDKLTGRTDQYSLAVSYVELRTGQLPYSSATAPAVYMAKMTGEYHLTQIQNPAVCQVLKRALARDPKERYATCGEFVRELTKAENTRIASGGGLKKLMAAAAVLLLVGLGGASAYEPSRTWFLGLIQREQHASNERKAEEQKGKAEQNKGETQRGSQGELEDHSGAEVTGDSGKQNEIDTGEKESKGGGKRESSVDVLPPAAVALEKLKQRLEQYGPGQPPLDANVENELFRLWEESLSGTAKRDELDAVKARLAELTFSKYLADDSALSDRALRGVILERAKLLKSEAVPLVAFVAAEAELERDANEAETAQRLKQQRIALTAAIQRLEKSPDSANEALLDYGRFLLARVISSAGPALRIADLQGLDRVVLAWTPASSTAAGDWRTPRRTAQAANLLVRLGDAALTLTDADIVRFNALRADEMVKASSYLVKAESLGETAPQLGGLLSVVRALGPDFSEQAGVAKAVANGSAGALADPEARSALSANKRERLVGFVGALASARLRDADDASRNQAAIAWFAAWLKDSGEFVDAERGDRDLDRGILENVVLPALSIPLTALPSELKPELAVIWSAKGRLVERNVSLIDIPGVRTSDHNDPDVAAMLTARQAYVEARRLADGAAYASGFARTSLKLPTEFDDNQRVQSLAEIVTQFDPQGTSQDQGLLLAGAWVKRRQALAATSREQQLKLVEDSLGRYDALLAATALDDPYVLGTVAQVNASATHLQAAFWTPIESADEARQPSSSNKRPAEMSKYEHLQRALQFARAARTDDTRRLPEEAFIAEGNALEDLALYYKLITNYLEADAAFEEAVRTTGAFRSNAYALLCLGRCQLRAALDAAEIAGDHERHRALLKSAYQHLTAAVARPKEDDPRHFAEANWWLGQTLYRSVLAGPGGLSAEGNRPLAAKSLNEIRGLIGLESSRAAAEAELRSRLKTWEQAAQHFVVAAERAKQKSQADYPLMLRDGLRARLDLAAQLRGWTAYAPQIDRAALLNDIAAGAEDLLSLAKKNPEAVAPVIAHSALSMLADARAELPLASPAGAKGALKTLKDWEHVFDRPTDDWRVQRVGVVLMQAKRGYDEKELAAAKKEVQRAEDLLEKITNDVMARQARGDCQRTLAEVIYAAYFADLSTGKLSREAYLDLDTAQQLYFQAEASLARAEDPSTEALLKQIRDQKLLNLESGTFRPDLSELAAHRIKRFILGTRQLRFQACNILVVLLGREALGAAYQNVAFSPDQVIRARRYHDLAKPLAFVSKQEPMNPDLRTILRMVELKLSLQGGK